MRDSRGVNPHREHSSGAKTGGRLAANIIREIEWLPANSFSSANWEFNWELASPRCAIARKGLPVGRGVSRRPRQALFPRPTPSSPTKRAKTKSRKFHRRGTGDRKVLH